MNPARSNRINSPRRARVAKNIDATSNGMKAKKSLGQHFLRSEKALAQIVDAGDIRTDDVVLEIGPGQGVLTERLLSVAKKVIAIEKDRELIPVLHERFAREIAEGRLDIIEQDILKFDPAQLGTSRYKLIANIPYYITGAIIEQFLSTTQQPERMVLLIQKEVAERIVCRDGKQSVLSIAVGAYGVPKIIAKVPAGAFVPAPKVDSAILAITNISRGFFDTVSEKAFFNLVKAIFGKKRKQVGGSLAEYLGDKEKAHTILTALTISPKARPETLQKESFKAMLKESKA